MVYVVVRYFVLFVYVTCIVFLCELSLSNVLNLSSERVYCVEIRSRLWLIRAFCIHRCLSVLIMDDWKLKTSPVVRLERSSER